MFICELSNGKQLEVREWNFDSEGGYLKIENATFDQIDQFIPEDVIITSAKIYDDSSSEDDSDELVLVETYNTYLNRKSVLVQKETVYRSVVTEQQEKSDNEEDTLSSSVSTVQTIPENITVITVSFEKPNTDDKVNSIADYVGYVENPNSLSLDDYKKYAIKNSKDELETYLLNNPLKSSIHGSQEKSYAITENKQILLLLEITVATVASEKSLSYQPSWNASGEVCEPWTLDELIGLSFEIAGIVKPLVSYQQSLEEQIMSKTSIEDIKSIAFDFSGNDPRNKDKE